MSNRSRQSSTSSVSSSLSSITYYTPGCTSLDSLPPEIWQRIMNHLEYDDLKAFFLVSKHWKELVYEDDSFWKLRVATECGNEGISIEKHIL